MAYIVLTLGVLMALVGLGAMATGYPVIEVERGWATVIAGAVLLSGGVVTAALGLVVRLLHKLEGVSRPLHASAATPVFAAQVAASEEDPVAPAASATPVSAAVAPAFAVAAPVAATAAFGAWIAHERTPAFDAASPAHADPEPDPVSAHADEEPAEAHIAEDLHAPMDEPEQADEPEPADEEVAAHEPHHLEPAPVAPRQEEHAPQSEAWLDQAFQAFDYEMTGNHASGAEAPAASHAEPEVPSQAAPPHESPHESPHDAWVAEEPVEPAHEDAAHDLAAAEATAHEPEPSRTHDPAEADAPATAPDAPGNLAVIGRYDSEGTSYVMYSDGSIEAQSEAGVYRFGSMAELKAFIEG